MDKTTILVQDLFDTNVIMAFQKVMRLSLPYQTSRALIKLAEVFDTEKKTAQAYLEKNFPGRTFAQLKEAEESPLQDGSPDAKALMTNFKSFCNQTVTVSSVPMSDLKNANIEPIVLKILTGKILVED